jgi:hypothetical protein
MVYKVWKNERDPRFQWIRLLCFHYRIDAVKCLDGWDQPARDIQRQNSFLLFFFSLCLWPVGNVELHSKSSDFHSLFACTQPLRICKKVEQWVFVVKYFFGTRILSIFTWVFIFIIGGTWVMGKNSFGTSIKFFV